MTLEDKIGVTSFFNTNWLETSIHFAGLEFDPAELEEWIRIEYTPNASKSLDIAFSNYTSKGVLEVSIYARKENRTYELYDLVLTMIRGAKFGDLKIKHIDILNKSNFQTLNGDYINLDVGIYLSSL
mgnify:CR=1 FL=1